MDYFNVPMALLQEVKEDPLQWSLVALSVAMKCLSPSSTYIFTSEKRFRGDFHLGYTKARNLFQNCHSVCEPCRFCECVERSDIVRYVLQRGSLYTGHLNGNQFHILDGDEAGLELVPQCRQIVVALQGVLKVLGKLV